MPKEHDNKILIADIQDHYTKQQLEHMLKNKTLPKNLLEVYELAKSFWFHNGKGILIKDYHTRKAIREGSV